VKFHTVWHRMNCTYTHTHTHTHTQCDELQSMCSGISETLGVDSWICIPAQEGSTRPETTPSGLVLKEPSYIIPNMTCDAVTED